MPGADGFTCWWDSRSYFCLSRRVTSRVMAPRSRAAALQRTRDLADQPVRTRALQRFAAHLAVEFRGVFGFLFDPTVDATNWRAEQALRQPWSIVAGGKSFATRGHPPTDPGGC